MSERNYIITSLSMNEYVRILTQLIKEQEK